jgi:CubicO group peptidase (beta-lactamase class C family)
MELRPGTPNEAGMLPERIDRVRDLCAGWVESGHTPAIVALVARRGVIVLHEAFGKLGPGPDSPPVQLDTIWPAMSITKPMTATLVMQLVEDGLLGLNRPVRDYLPEVTGEGTQDMLVHHLLTHTAGYDDFAFFTAHASEYADMEQISPEVFLQRVHQAIHGMPLSKPPGMVMNYAATGYFLLGEIVERVSGRPIDELMRERLFGPLGMKDSYLVVPESVRERIVRRSPGLPWTSAIGPVPAIDSRLNQRTPSAQGGAYSTARELAVFGQTFLNGGTYGGARILSRPAVAEMTRNQIPGTPVEMGEIAHKEASYGYGWFVRSNEKWKYWDGSLTSLGEFHHQGAGGSLLWVDPGQEIVGVYLSVDTGITPDFEPLWNADLFQNAVTSAVLD